MFKRCLHFSSRCIYNFKENWYKQSETCLALFLSKRHIKSIVVEIQKYSFIRNSGWKHLEGEAFIHRVNIFLNINHN